MIQPDQPFVTIIVPTHKRRDLLKRLLESLSKLSYPVDKYEVIVIGDITYSDGTEKLVRDMVETVPFRLHYFESQLKAPSVKRNLGIKKAGGELVGFTDDDCVADPNWIVQAIPFFSDPLVMGVQGKTIIPLPGQLSPAYHHATGLMNPGYQTCNIFYRKRALEEIGGFDERFTSSSREDSDLAFTLLRKGCKMEYAPEAIVAHPVRDSEPWDLIKSAQGASADALLFKKHPHLYRENIGSVFSNSYRLFYLLLTGAIAFAVFGYYIVAVSFLISYLSTLFLLAFKQLKGSNLSYQDCIKFLISLLISPYILLYSVFRGNLKHKSLLWY